MATEHPEEEAVIAKACGLCDYRKTLLRT